MDLTIFWVFIHSLLGLLLKPLKVDENKQEEQNEVLSEADESTNEIKEPVPSVSFGSKLMAKVRSCHLTDPIFVLLCLSKFIADLGFYKIYHFGPSIMVKAGLEENLTAEVLR